MHVSINFVEPCKITLELTIVPSEGTVTGSDTRLPTPLVTSPMLRIESEKRVLGSGTSATL